jgi:DNA-binding LacI/PurR family transcriptional regulator
VSARPNRRVPRKEIAKAVGMSVSSVSNALNPTKGVRINEHTRAKILRVAKEMGYRRSFAARSIATGRAFAVGMLQPKYDAMRSSFYQAIVQGAAEAMADDDYHILLLFRSCPKGYQQAIEQGRMDGILVLQSDQDVSHIEKLLDWGVPTVVINKEFPVTASPHAGCVHSDHKKMMHDVVEEFLARGCRTMLVLSGSADCDANRLIYQGFSEALELGKPKGVTGSIMIISFRDFATQMDNMFQSGQRWDGIFVDGMGWADILLASAERHGLRAGHDFLLITSDTDHGVHTTARKEWCAYTQDPLAIGKAAWALMKAMVDFEAKHGSDAELQRHIRLPYCRTSINTDRPGRTGAP